MRRQKMINIKDLLETSDLAQIMRKGLFLNELNQQLQNIFPEQFGGLFRVVNIRHDSLNIEVAHASVRQGLLFRQNDLLEQIRQYFPEIKKLHFKVNPNLTSPVTPTN